MNLSLITSLRITSFRLFIILFFSEGKYVSKWFVGLDFNKMEGMNIDLTSDIQSFVENGKVHMLLLPHHCNYRQYNNYVKSNSK